jgi:hypothetical protein
METHYKRIDINGKEDLPTKQGYYTVHFSGSPIDKTDCLIWVADLVINPSGWLVVDYYLQPCQPDEKPTRERIIEVLKSHEIECHHFIMIPIDEYESIADELSKEGETK